MLDASYLSTVSLKNKVVPVKGYLWHTRLLWGVFTPAPDLDLQEVWTPVMLFSPLQFLAVHLHHMCFAGCQAAVCCLSKLLEAI
jgi:hypothetical protein